MTEQENIQTFCSAKKWLRCWPFSNFVIFCRGEMFWTGLPKRFSFSGGLRQKRSSEWGKTKCAQGGTLLAGISKSQLLVEMLHTVKGKRVPHILCALLQCWRFISFKLVAFQAKHWWWSSFAIFNNLCGIYFIFFMLNLLILSIFRWHEDHQDHVHPAAEGELHEAHWLQDVQQHTGIWVVRPVEG